MHTVCRRLLMVGLAAGLLAACGSADDAEGVGASVVSAGGAPVTTVPPVGSAADLDRFVGLSEAEAEALAQSENRPFRVAQRDGEEFGLTRDLRPDRVSVVVVDDVVTDAVAG